MSYFVTTLVVIVFFFIVLKKRIVPALSGLLKGLRGRAQPEAVSYCPSLPEMSGRMHFEVLTFFVSEAANSVELRERIEMRLNNAVHKLEDTGITCGIHYLTAGDALIIILDGRRAGRGNGNGNGRTGSIADGRTAAGPDTGN